MVTDDLSVVVLRQAALTRLEQRLSTLLRESWQEKQADYIRSPLRALERLGDLALKVLREDTAAISQFRIQIAAAADFDVLSRVEAPPTPGEPLLGYARSDLIDFGGLVLVGLAAIRAGATSPHSSHFLYTVRSLVRAAAPAELLVNEGFDLAASELLEVFTADTLGSLSDYARYVRPLLVFPRERARWRAIDRLFDTPPEVGYRHSPRALGLLTSPLVPVPSEDSTVGSVPQYFADTLFAPLESAQKLLARLVGNDPEWQLLGRVRWMLTPPTARIDSVQVGETAADLRGTFPDNTPDDANAPLDSLESPPAALAPHVVFTSHAGQTSYLRVIDWSPNAISVERPQGVGSGHVAVVVPELLGLWRKARRLILESLDEDGPGFGIDVQGSNTLSALIHEPDLLDLTDPFPAAGTPTNSIPDPTPVSTPEPPVSDLPAQVVVLCRPAVLTAFELGQLPERVPAGPLVDSEETTTRLVWLDLPFVPDSLAYVTDPPDGAEHPGCGRLLEELAALSFQVPGLEDAIWAVALPVARSSDWSAISTCPTARQLVVGTPGGVYRVILDVLESITEDVSAEGAAAEPGHPTLLSYLAAPDMAARATASRARLLAAESAPAQASVATVQRQLSSLGVPFRYPVEAGPELQIYQTWSERLREHRVRQQTSRLRVVARLDQGGRIRNATLRFESQRVGPSQLEPSDIELRALDAAGNELGLLPLYRVRSELPAALFAVPAASQHIAALEFVRRSGNRRQRLLRLDRPRGRPQLEELVAEPNGATTRLRWTYQHGSRARGTFRIEALVTIDSTTEVWAPVVTTTEADGYLLFHRRSRNLGALRVVAWDGWHGRTQAVPYAGASPPWQRDQAALSIRQVGPRLWWADSDDANLAAAAGWHINDHVIDSESNLGEVRGAFCTLKFGVSGLLTLTGPDGTADQRRVSGK